MTDNNVEITVTGTDKTDPLWRGIKDKASKGGKTAGQAMAHGAASTAADATRAGGVLGEGLVSGVERKLRGSSGRFVKISSDVGKSSGDGMRLGFIGTAGRTAAEFVSALGGNLPKLLGNIKAAAPIAGAITAGAPLIGAAVSGAVVAGLSAGAVAGGVALAFNDPTVKAEASALGDFLSDRLQDAAGSFVEPTRQALMLVRTQWADVGDDIEGVFDAASRYVVPLTQGVMDTLKAVGPGLRSAVESAEPIINVISKELPQMGQAIGDMFEHMGEDAEDSAVALGVVFRTATSSIELVDTAIRAATKSFGMMTDTIESAADAEPDWLATGTALDWLSEKLGELRGETETTGHVISRLGEDADGSTYAFEAMAERTETMAGSMADAVDAAGSLASALEVLNGGVLDAREAEREYQEAIDDLSASLKTNGKTLDTNTAKGRENAENLDSLASSVAAHMDAVYSETAATKGSAAAQAAASRVYASGRAQVIASARAMGMGKAAAERYADSVLGIPKKWKTDIEADASDARSEAIAAAREIRGIPRSWTTNLYVNRHYAGNSVTGARETGGVVGSAATGGVRANRTLVGEAGPEIVDLAPGSRVHSAPDTQRMMAAGGDGAALGGGGGKIEVVLSIDPNMDRGVARALLEALRLDVRRSGGGIDGTITGVGA